jgi:hypothetical protein
LLGVQLPLQLGDLAGEVHVTVDRVACSNRATAARSRVPSWCVGPRSSVSVSHAAGREESRRPRAVLTASRYRRTRAQSRRPVSVRWTDR